MSGTDETGTSAERTVEDLDEIALSYTQRADGAGDAERARLREVLIRRALPFASRLARRYFGRGEPLEDLEQVARLGLVKAVDRYDPQRGSFTAYAVITVSGEIKRHFRDKTWGVHVPRRLQDLSLEIGHASVVLTNRLARSPTVAELAGYLDTSDEEILEAMESAAAYTPASLNAPIGGESPAELGDLFGAPDGDLDSVDDRLTVANLLCRLPARERRILAMRFYGNRTQSDIAAEFGISQMHVSRLLTRALTWLREAMLSDVPPPWEGAGTRDDTNELRVAVTAEADTVTVEVRGEVDRDTAERLRHGLVGAAGSPQASSVRVDLTAVPLLDAAGVAALLAGYDAARAAGIRFRIVGAQHYVARILAVSGLAPLLD
jgi:RNA polymerase sigma-B factor